MSHSIHKTHTSPASLSPTAAVAAAGSHAAVPQTPGPHNTQSRTLAHKPGQAQPVWQAPRACLQQFSSGTHCHQADVAAPLPCIRSSHAAGVWACRLVVQCLKSQEAAGAAPSAAAHGAFALAGVGGITDAGSVPTSGQQQEREGSGAAPACEDPTLQGRRSISPSTSTSTRWQGRQA
jgi:hypothetical protein